MKFISLFITALALSPAAYAKTTTFACTPRNGQWPTSEYTVVVAASKVQVYLSKNYEGLKAKGGVAQRWCANVWRRKLIATFLLSRKRSHGINIF